MGLATTRCFLYCLVEDLFCKRCPRALMLLLWNGRFNIPFSFVPVKYPQLVAIGAPIPVEQCTEPTQAQIDELHSKYCVAIRHLFDKHKTDPILQKTGFAERKLYFEDEK